MVNDDKHKTEFIVVGNREQKSTIDTIDININGSGIIFLACQKWHVLLYHIENERYYNIPKRYYYSILKWTGIITYKKDRYYSIPKRTGIIALYRTGMMLYILSSIAQ